MWACKHRKLPAAIHPVHSPRAARAGGAARPPDPPPPRRAARHPPPTACARGEFTWRLHCVHLRMCVKEHKENKACVCVFVLPRAAAHMGRTRPQLSAAPASAARAAAARMGLRTPGGRGSRGRGMGSKQGQGGSGNRRGEGAAPPTRTTPRSYPARVHSPPPLSLSYTYQHLPNTTLTSTQLHPTGLYQPALPLSHRTPTSTYLIRH